jgi:putative two-component system response regulator
MREIVAHIRTQRDAGIAALVAIGPSLNASRLSANRDLDALTVREALLRQKVAERRLLTERIEMFERFAITADLKEDASGRHGYRVGRLCGLLAQRLEWSRSSVATLEMTARLHDIGKVAVPDRVLLTSQRLEEADRRLIAAHTIAGGELLSRSDLPDLRIAEEIARHHHEWWDGTGYPSKLSGKRIPIHARIVALADVFDALTHGRPYAPAWPIDRALEEIRQRRGTQFDPDLTDAFLALIDELRREHSDLDAFLGEASRNSPFLQARDKIRMMLEGGRQAENIAAAAAETVH